MARWHIGWIDIDDEESAEIHYEPHSTKPRLKDAPYPDLPSAVFNNEFFVVVASKDWGDAVAYSYGDMTREEFRAKWNK